MSSTPPTKRRTRKNSEGRMPLRGHLVELRNRSVVAGVAILLAAIGGWFLYDPVLEELIEPLTDLAESREGVVSPNFNSVAAAFDFKVKISVYIGIFIASPIWIYQVWAFITPGLKKNERRYALGFMMAAVPLFFGGAFFGYWFVPLAVRFFVQFTPGGFSNIIDAQVYLTFVTQVILAFGVGFLVPLILVALNFLGLMGSATMLRGWRWMVVAAFTFAAIVTPTADVVTMFLLAVPLLVLFAIAVLVAWLNDRVRRSREAKFDAELDAEAPGS